jgi:hypothetical protein
MKGVPPVLVSECLEEGADELIEEAAEIHPQVVDVPPEDPGRPQEARRHLNHLFIILLLNGRDNYDKAVTR